MRRPGVHISNRGVMPRSQGCWKTPFPCWHPEKLPAVWIPRKVLVQWMPRGEHAHGPCGRSNSSGRQGAPWSCRVLRVATSRPGGDQDSPGGSLEGRREAPSTSWILSSTASSSIPLHSSLSKDMRSPMAQLTSSKKKKF